MKFRVSGFGGGLILGNSPAGGVWSRMAIVFPI